MKCKRCKAYISGKNTACPLCGNDLAHEDGITQNVFPEIEIVSPKEKLFIKILTLVLLSGTVLCVMLNITLTPSVPWSLFVAGGAACLWSSLMLALKARRYLPKAIFWEVLFISSLAVIWDISTGYHGWSIDFIIPILFSGAIIITGILALILKMAINDYIVYLISNGIFGIIPLVFILTGMLNVVVPSMLCVTISIISLATLFIFQRERFLDEIQRRTHI